MINIVGIFMISNICTKLQANYLKDNCHHHHHHHSEFDDEEEEEDHEEEEEEEERSRVRGAEGGEPMN